MDKVNNLFGGGTNPMTTPVGQLVDKATDQMTPDANLELYFEICDLVNVIEDNAKDAMRAIRKKLSVFAGKNWTVVLKLLLLLETCSNNCNKKFQILLANKDFLQELKSMIGPKLQPPLQIQEKVLFLIQHWTTIFKNDADFKPIESFYNELRTKGVDFPLYDPESTTTSLDINTTSLGVGANKQSPQVENASQQQFSSLPPNIQNQNVNRTINGNSLPHQQIFQRIPEAFNPSGTVVKLNEEQIAKLNSEIDIVDSNVQVLNEILTELQSSPKAAANNKAITQSENDLSLLIELNKTCREMQKRITQLIGNISNENVINELLRVNDDLNNVFLRYERFERNNGIASTPSPKQQQQQQQPQSPSIQTNSNSKQTANITLPPPPSQSNKSHPSHRNTNEKLLIDFNDDVGASSAASGKKTSATADNDFIDSLKNLQVSNNSSAKKQDDEFSDINAFLHDENEIKEMENWLKSQGHKLSSEAGTPTASGGSEAAGASKSKDDKNLF